MNVNTLIKKLTAIRDSGGGRHQVVVDKGSLWDGNGTFENCDIHSVENAVVYMVDGDGGFIVNKDGSERCRTSVVLSGKG
jgi:hypothetical protein